MGWTRVTLSGPTHVSLVTPEGHHDVSWTPENFGLTSAAMDGLHVADPQASAAMIRHILDGAPGTPRAIVVLNAAAALWTAGKSSEPAVCAQLAAEALDNGGAKRVLADLVRVSQA